MNEFRDEPVIVSAPPRARAGRWIGIAIVALLIGIIGGTPLYQMWLDKRAHEALRGPHGGSLYTIQLNGTDHTIELGWTAPKLTAFITPAPPPGAVLHMSGRAGEANLAWDTENQRFGPAGPELNPFAHHKLKLTLSAAGRTLWSDTLWAYAVHEEGHHH